MKGRAATTVPLTPSRPFPAAARSPANLALQGLVEAGMTIIAVNGTECRKLSKRETALLIRAGDTVMLTVQSKNKRTSMAPRA